MTVIGVAIRSGVFGIHSVTNKWALDELPLFRSESSQSFFVKFSRAQIGSFGFEQVFGRLE